MPRTASAAASGQGARPRSDVLEVRGKRWAPSANVTRPAGAVLGQVVDVWFVAGVVVLVAQGVSFSLFAMMQKELLTTYKLPKMSVVAWTVAGSSVFCVLAALIKGKAPALVDITQHYTSRGILILLYAAFLGMLLMQWLMSYAHVWLPNSIVTTMIVACQPPLSSYFQWHILGVPLGLVTVAGNVLATIGVVLLGREQYMAQLVTVTPRIIPQEAAKRG